MGADQSRQMEILASSKLHSTLNLAIVLPKITPAMYPYYLYRTEAHRYLVHMCSKCGFEAGAFLVREERS